MLAVRHIVLYQEICAHECQLRATAFFSLAITLRLTEFDINSQDPTQSQPRLTLYTLDLRIDYGLLMAIVHALAAASSDSDVVILNIFPRDEPRNSESICRTNIY
jgi:hypothetical protein